MVWKLNSTRDEEKSFVAERFIEALKNKIYKYLNSLSKVWYFDVRRHS